MAYMNTTRTAGNSFFDGFGTISTDLSRRWARYRMFRRTVSELSELSNRELADLGLHRSSIRAIAADAARQVK
ncbi:DUF1127 domain-containing protein [Profundibacterium mesophilum]|uniref:YjiS-like domain-containing protein n=1 Tax=Profundibacterium mesophilum KAUST100406-0324 TaxID=1037889 RepID=A0A921NVA1_9RHOB|nr:DUF1127 domain-containing protein [Profundibacterium mesophilum]KAF0675444.1 hypothetical protein PMES_02335 [Profundibacterium mesophilum KAUST100406-0324]